MDKYIVTGGIPLRGEVKVSGAKNVAMKVILAGLLTDEPIKIYNCPLISSVYGTIEMVKPLGVKVQVESDHTLTIKEGKLSASTIPLEMGGLYRTATMVIGPLLARLGKAIVPNPGGCRLGKRPIDRHICGLEKMGAKIKYEDGYFKAETKKLHGTHYRFDKNTHTGTETLILAAVLAEGETVLENAAAEPEVDDLIRLLIQMGAKIRRQKRTIIIDGVKRLTGTDFEIMPDRNEVITFAVASIITGGDITVEGTQRDYLQPFLDKLTAADAGWEPLSPTKTRFFKQKFLRSTDIVTLPYPGFMTDWQAPWALLMTQADGVSTVHETIYESRFSYVGELRKMGAQIEFFDPLVPDPKSYYNFNWEDKKEDYFQGIRIKGPTILHDAVLEVADLRAGATLVLAALSASGRSYIHGIEHINRGYENLEGRLVNLGAKIERAKE